MIDNNLFGGFIVSNNVIAGKQIRYSYREKSKISKLNGWTILSVEDDNDYVSNSDNFTILGANTVNKIAPVMLEIFSAKYGTDLFWIYENNVHIGFYDLISDREVTIQEILEI